MVFDRSFVLSRGQSGPARGGGRRERHPVRRRAPEHRAARWARGCGSARRPARPGSCAATTRRASSPSSARSSACPTARSAPSGRRRRCRGRGLDSARAPRAAHHRAGRHRRPRPRAASRPQRAHRRDRRGQDHGDRRARARARRAAATRPSCVQGATAARIQARFDAPADAGDWAEDGEVILARSVGADGKSTARIGGQLATASALARARRRARRGPRPAPGPTAPRVGHADGLPRSLRGRRVTSSRSPPTASPTTQLRARSWPSWRRSRRPRAIASASSTCWPIRSNEISAVGPQPDESDGAGGRGGAPGACGASPREAGAAPRPPSLATRASPMPLAGRRRQRWRRRRRSIRRPPTWPTRARGLAAELGRAGPRRPGLPGVAGRRPAAAAGGPRARWQP